MGAKIEVIGKERISASTAFCSLTKEVSADISHQSIATKTGAVLIKSLVQRLNEPVIRRCLVYTPPCAAVGPERCSGCCRTHSFAQNQVTSSPD